MPRSVPIARLVVDAPQNSANRRNSINEWLLTHAAELAEYPAETFTTGRYRARNFLGGGNAVATLRITALGCLSDKTRQRIAKWLVSRAVWVRKHGAGHNRRWFTQEFSL